MKKPKTSLSFRITYEQWEKISEFVEKNGLDFSSGARELIDHGLWLDSHKQDIQDPEKVGGIIKEWTAKMNENEILQWPLQLSDDQIKAAHMSLEMEKERRVNI